MKRAHELANDYQYCILLDQDLRKLAQAPEFEDDDREAALVASNKLRQMVAPSEFIGALKSVFGRSRVVFIKEKAYFKAKKSRDAGGLAGITDAQLLYNLGIEKIRSNGAQPKNGVRRVASAKMASK